MSAVKSKSLLLETAEYQFFLDALSATKTRKPSKKSSEAADKYRQGIRQGARSAHQLSHLNQGDRVYAGKV